MILTSSIVKNDSNNEKFDELIKFKYGKQNNVHKIETQEYIIYDFSK